MADKVYYEVSGIVMVPVRVRAEIVARTEASSSPGRAVATWAKRTDRSHFRDADIEVTNVAVVGKDGAVCDGTDGRACVEDVVIDFLQAHIVDAHRGGCRILEATPRVVDAK